MCPTACSTLAEIGPTCQSPNKLNFSPQPSSFAFSSYKLFVPSTSHSNSSLSLAFLNMDYALLGHNLKGLLLLVRNSSHSYTNSMQDFTSFYFQLKATDNFNCSTSFLVRSIRNFL